MLGQSKTVFQAEIDAACELIDFWRFNAALRAGAATTSSRSATTRCGTSSTTAPLEGFVYAVTPFNFTSIAGNLPTAPALMGNTVIWKPASSGDALGVLPDEAARGGRAAAGRDQLRARRSGDDLERRCSAHRDLAGVHFTGSTDVFNNMWKTIGANMSSYRSYPRIVGETGGKDFIVAHPSADRAGARRRDRARRLRVPGAEVLGGEPRLRAAARSGPTCAIARSAMIDEIKHGRPGATSATSWAR